MDAKSLFKRHEKVFAELTKDNCNGLKFDKETVFLSFAIIYSACIISETIKNEMAEQEFDQKAFEAQGGNK